MAKLGNESTLIISLAHERAMKEKEAQVIRYRASIETGHFTPKEAFEQGINLGVKMYEEILAKIQNEIENR